MHRSRINIGKAVREYRKESNITKEKLAEELKVSVSYVEKIKTGRMPGMRTYQKLTELLDMVVPKRMETVQEKCAGKVQKILLGSTEGQAVFMANMVEAMSQNTALVVMQK